MDFMGSLSLPGYETPLVAPLEFEISSKALLQDLFSGVEDCSDFSDVDASDSRVVSVNDIIERGIQAFPQEGDKDKSPGKKKRKRVRGGGNRKRGRPCDRETRAAALEMENELFTELLEERKVSKENALASLHSLRIKENGLYSRQRIRTAGSLKFNTSVIEAPPVVLPSDSNGTALNELLISIDFHNPYNLKMQEFLVLGSQPLTALKDQLYCVTDTVALQKNMVVPSGYFFIENVFYNDMRHPEAVDYSEPIMNWLEERENLRKQGKRGKRFAKLPSMRSASMADTRFQDLQLKLGAQYLYCHQGACKHIVVFRDMRLAHRNDVQNPGMYPLLRFFPRLRFKKCSVCAVYRAKKVTYDDKLAPSNPCFFCEKCYDFLHYSSDGSLLYDEFSVHDYFHE